MPMHYLYICCFRLEYYCLLVAAVIVAGLIFVATWPFRGILSQYGLGGDWPGFDDNDDDDGGGGGDFPATKPQLLA